LQNFFTNAEADAMKMACSDTLQPIKVASQPLSKRHNTPLNPPLLRGDSRGVLSCVYKLKSRRITRLFSVAASAFMQHLGLQCLAKETFEMVFLVCESFILPETEQVYKQ
jgi:hypothetical protein